MKTYKFHSYDSGFIRAYFKSESGLYCFQPNYGLEFLVCSRDGEPSHRVTIDNGDLFTGFDMANWAYADLVEYFADCHNDRAIIAKMECLWGNQ